MKKELTVEEKVTNIETLIHIRNVGVLLMGMSKALLDRAVSHDCSKLESPEVGIFTEFTPKLAGCTYGSDAYKGYLKNMGVALKHHYRENRHHPEHFEDGINCITLIDLVEMLCDWKAATLRHNDGCIHKSIDINTGRFGMGDQMKKILQNTAELLFEDNLEKQRE